MTEEVSQKLSILYYEYSYTLARWRGSLNKFTQLNKLHTYGYNQYCDLEPVVRIGVKETLKLLSAHSLDRL